MLSRPVKSFPLYPTVQHPEPTLDITVDVTLPFSSFFCSAWKCFLEVCCFYPHQEKLCPFMWSQHYAATKSLQYQWLSHQVPCRYPGLPDTSLPRNNMALCDLKRQEWGRAVDTTTEILQRNAKNTKVLKIWGLWRHSNHCNQHKRL